MRRILIAEPDDNVRRLLVQLVVDLGHEAVVWEPPQTSTAPFQIGSAGRLGDIDVLLLDPDWPDAVALVRDVQAGESQVGVICMSFRPHQPRSGTLRPLAYLRKPFSAEALEWVLAQATAPPREAPR